MSTTITSTHSRPISGIMLVTPDLHHRQQGKERRPSAPASAAPSSSSSSSSATSSSSSSSSSTSTTTNQCPSRCVLSHVCIYIHIHMQNRHISFTLHIMHGPRFTDTLFVLCLCSCGHVQLAALPFLYSKHKHLFLS